MKYVHNYFICADAVNIASDQIQYMLLVWFQVVRRSTTSHCPPGSAHEVPPLGSSPAVVAASISALSVVSTLAAHDLFSPSLHVLLVEQIVALMLDRSTAALLASHCVSALVVLFERVDDATLFALLAPFLWNALPTLDEGVLGLNALRQRPTLMKAITLLKTDWTDAHERPIDDAHSPSSHVTFSKICGHVSSESDVWTVATDAPALALPDSVRAAVVPSGAPYESGLARGIAAHGLLLEGAAPLPFEHSLRPQTAGMDPRVGVAGLATGDDRCPPLGWSPRGVLVSHLVPHQAPIRALTVTPSRSSFATASLDGSACLFSLARLETPDEHRPLAVVRPAGAAALESTLFLSEELLALGARDGTVSLFDVSRASDSGDLRATPAAAWALPSGSPVVALLPFGEAGAGHFAALTQTGGLFLLDSRAPRRDPLWSLAPPPALGVILRGLADFARLPHLLATGTSEGVVATWDVRFSSPTHPLTQWSYPAELPIRGLALSAPARAPVSPSVWVATPGVEVGECDLASGAVLRVYRAGTSRLPAPLASSSTASESERVPRALQPRAVADHSGSPRPAIARLIATASLPESPAGQAAGAIPGALSALLPCPEGRLIASGSDRCVHLIDPARPAQCGLMCAPYHEMVYPDAHSGADADAARAGASHVPGRRAKSLYRKSRENAAGVLQKVLSVRYRVATVDGVPVMDQDIVGTSNRFVPRTPDGFCE